MGAMVCQITGVTIIYTIVCSGSENIKALRHWSFVWIPRSKAENASIWWRHHALEKIDLDAMEPHRPLSNNT